MAFPREARRAVPVPVPEAGRREGRKAGRGGASGTAAAARCGDSERPDARDDRSASEGRRTAEGRIGWLWLAVGAPRWRERGLGLEPSRGWWR